MPMQPKPRAETSRALRPFPRVRFCITFSSFLAPPGVLCSQAGSLLKLLRVPGPLNLDSSGGVLDLAQVVDGKHDVGRADILLEAVEFLGSRDGNDPWLLREEPGQRYLCRRRLLALRDRAEQFDQGLVGFAGLRREPGDD